ncbi:MAG: glycosyltransferase, partial [Eggerthellaceae bacterium]|nr:glycosyltransferase [Eggerthellaceae bacterium]
MTEGKHTYAIFSALYAPHMGGVESYTAGLAKELAARGSRVVVMTSRLAPEHPEHEIQADGVEVLRLPCKPLLGGRLPWPARNARHAQLLEQLAAIKPTRIAINTRFYGHS